MPSSAPCRSAAADGRPRPVALAGASAGGGPRVPATALVLSAPAQAGSRGAPSESPAEAGEDGAPQPEWRRTHADAAAIAQLVDGVEGVDQVEPRRPGATIRPGEILRHAEIEAGIGRQLLRIGEAPAQPVGVEH